MDGQRRRVSGEEPDPISVRTEAYPGGTMFPRAGQAWGELNFAISGVCEFVIAGRSFLSPPSYGIWIPPGVEHEAWNRQDILYATVYVSRTLCGDLPKHPRTIVVGPLLKAIVADFFARKVTVPQSEADHRLARVLVDQISVAPDFDAYLPTSDDLLLRPVIAALEETPGSKTSLAEWARRAGITERTMARRWVAAMGIGFNEWRQRIRIIRALELLDAGEQVQVVAHTLGYGTSSAFIAMFRRMTGRSPTEASP